MCISMYFYPSCLLGKVYIFRVKIQSNGRKPTASVIGVANIRDLTLLKLSQMKLGKALWFYLNSQNNLFNYIFKL